MSLQFGDREPEANELLILIRNKQPVSAALLSELLSALSKDYSKRNRGRTLVVSRIEAGSWWLYFTDLVQAVVPYAKSSVEVAKGAKAIFDFSKSIHDALNNKNSPQDSEAKNLGVNRVVEAMVKIAAETGSELEVRAGNGLVDAKLTPPQALEIRERARLAALQARIVHPQRPLMPRDNQGDQTTRAKELADQITKIPLSDPGGMNGLIATFVGVVQQAGSDHILDTLESELEARGEFDHAAAVREARGGKSGQQFTTT